LTAQRLQKVLARAGIASRRHAEQLIREGRVRVAGKVVTEQGVLVEPRDCIEVDGRRIAEEPLVYVLLHKPRRVMCTMRDPEGRRTVAEFVRDAGARVVPVGRLDYDTSGVLLLTNDGDLSRALAHPSGGVLKEYVLQLRGTIDDAGLERLRDSIDIKGRATRPARVEMIRTEAETTWLTIVLHEGKNRQIRRLAEHAGYRVLGLSRNRFGGLTAAGLAPGQWRHLTASELQVLRSNVGAASGSARSRSSKR
jgi:23S rRNA pseudouridine2605 synthase